MTAATLAIPGKGLGGLPGGLAARQVRYFKAQVEDWYDEYRRLTEWEDENLLDSPAPQGAAVFQILECHRHQFRRGPVWEIRALHRVREPASYALQFVEEQGVLSQPFRALSWRDCHDNAKDRKFEDVVKSAEQAAVLVLVY